MINYRKLAREVFKTLCRTEYKNDSFLGKNRVHKDIRSKFKIGDDKLSEFLGTYEFVKNGEVCYRNPFRYEEVVISMIENLMGVNIRPPAGIDYLPDIQIKEGKTPDELSLEIERKYGTTISPAQIRSILRKSSSKGIKEGAAGYFYISPD